MCNSICGANGRSYASGRGPQRDPFFSFSFFLTHTRTKKKNRGDANYPLACPNFPLENKIVPFAFLPMGAFALFFFQINRLLCFGFRLRIGGGANISLLCSLDARNWSRTPL
jgi:hypothetical protein